MSQNILQSNLHIQNRPTKLKRKTAIKYINSFVRNQTTMLIILSLADLIKQRTPFLKNIPRLITVDKIHLVAKIKYIFNNNIFNWQATLKTFFGDYIFNA